MIYQAICQKLEETYPDEKFWVEITSNGFVLCSVSKENHVSIVMDYIEYPVSAFKEAWFLSELKQKYPELNEIIV